MTDGASEYFVLFHHKVLVACAVEVRHRMPGTAQDKPKGRTLCRACPACYRARPGAESLCGFVENAAAPGQPARAVAGPFAQVLDVRERLDAKGRVRVPLNIMCGQVPMIVDRAN